MQTVYSPRTEGHEAQCDLSKSMKDEGRGPLALSLDFTGSFLDIGSHVV